MSLVAVREAPALPGYEEPWWRALAVFRVFSVGYAAVLLVLARDDYAHVMASWLVLAALAAWTAATFVWYRQPRRRRWPLLSLDLLVAAAAIVVSRPLQLPEAVERGAQTLPVFWVVAPVIAWALVYGWFAAVPASAVIGIANVVERGAVTAPLAHNTVLVLVAGTVVGYVADLARGAERRLAEALHVEATTRAHHRLATAVHDGVLQVLAYVARRGRELGGESAELARLAAEQEAALRALISTTPQSHTSGSATSLDLRELLLRASSPMVSVATPPDPVLLADAPAREVAAAVNACLDNVRQHAGPTARTFILLEEDGDDLVIAVRDDGEGFPPGRLEQAAAEGRMGVARSIIGRLAELGGSADIRGVPGEGVEVVMRLPRLVRSI